MIVQTARNRVMESNCLPRMSHLPRCRNALMKQLGLFLSRCFSPAVALVDSSWTKKFLSHDSVDPLAPSDGHGVLHQMPTVRATDFDRRISAGVGSITSRRMSN